MGETTQLSAITMNPAEPSSNTRRRATGVIEHPSISKIFELCLEAYPHGYTGSRTVPDDEFFSLCPGRSDCYRSSTIDDEGCAHARGRPRRRTRDRHWATRPACRSSGCSPSQSECAGSEIFSGLPLAQSTISEHLRVLKDAACARADRSAPAWSTASRLSSSAEFAAAIDQIATVTPPCSSTEKDGVC